MMTHARPRHSRRLRSRIPTARIRWTRLELLENLESRFLLTTFVSSTPISIPSSGSASPYPSQIVVPTLPGPITDVNVTLTGLTHTYPEDIDILLVGPSGQSVLLMSDCGSFYGVSGINLTFDDSAASSLSTIQLSSGTFLPSNIGTGDTFNAPAPAGPYGSALSVFNGTPANGTWSLYLVDDFAGDSGSISGGWSLNIAAGPQYDYGDAPALYPTLAANNGPVHTVVPGIRLGNAVDDELDGQPNATATGDDANGLDDEDGVVFNSALVAGSSTGVTVTASAPGYLNAWIDFNSDGDWADSGEHVFTDTPLTTGANNLNFSVPTAITSVTYARFRFSTTAGLSFTGSAPDGEVEDYALGVISGTAFNDLNADGIRQSATEPLLPNITVFADWNNNGLLDAGEASAVTSASGAYSIAGLPAHNYSIEQVPSNLWKQTYPSIEKFDTPLVNVQGQGYSNVLPPDTVGDIGPLYYVQATNDSAGTHITVYNKADGSVAVSQFVLSSLANSAVGGSPYTGRGDPIVLYDHLAGRWLLSEFESSGNEIDIFLSDNSAPTSNGADWTQYRVNATNFPDYQKITLWNNAYLIGTNEADNPVYAIDRNAMLTGAGGLISFIRRTGTPRPNWPRGHTMPADIDGPAAPADSPGLFLRQIDDEVTNPGANDPSHDFIEIWEFQPDFTTPANSTYTLARTITINDFDYVVGSDSTRADLDQPGTAVKLDALPYYLGWHLQYRNFGSYETLVGNFTVDASGAEQAGIRWFELRKTAGVWNLYQEGTYAPDATNRWMGSIAMDGSGNIALGYSVTSSTVYPGVRYAGRRPTDPLGTLPRGENTLFAGSGSQTSSSNRWGDYSAMTVDPVDDSTFWYTNEYIPANGLWTTRIGAFAFGPPGNAKPHSVSLADGATVSGINFGDHFVPVINVTTPTNAGFFLTGTPALNATAGIDADDLPPVTFRIYAGPTASGSPLLTLLASAAPGTGFCSVTVPLAGVLPQGIYTVQASQDDNTGSTGFSPAVTFTVYTLPGDADLSGNVNFADFVILSNHYGLPTTAGPGNGDFNADAIVNFADFVILSNHYGQSLAAQPAIQPEVAITSKPVTAPAAASRPGKKHAKPTAPRRLELDAAVTVPVVQKISVKSAPPARGAAWSTDPRSSKNKRVEVLPAT
jgi:subtilisin-like proprotein convertase family protein